MEYDNQIPGSILSRVTGNTFILIAAQILEKVVNFFLIIILVRYLSENKFGQYGFATSYVVLFNVFINLGLTGLCTREISQKPKLASHILTASLVPMFFASLVTFAAIHWSIIFTKPGQTEMIHVVQLAAGCLILNSFTGIFGTVPRAYEKMIYVAIPRLVKQLVFLLLCLALLPTGVGLTGVYGFMLVASLIELLLQIYFCVKKLFVIPSWRFDGSLCRKMLKEAYPLALTSVFVIIYYKIDSVMLSYMQNDIQVGLYTAAYNLAFLFLFLATSLHQAILPVFSKLYINSRDLLHRIYELSVKYLIIAGLPISVGMILLASRIVLLVFGERYLECASALQILMGAFLLMFVNGLMGNTMIATGNQKDLARIVGMGTLINVGLNLIIIPYYGFLGAAATTVVTELYAGAYSWFILRRYHHISVGLACFIRPLICCALMSAFIVLFSSLPLFFIILAAALIYSLSLFIFRVVSTEDLSTVKKIIYRT